MEYLFRCVVLISLISLMTSSPIVSKKRDTDRKDQLHQLQNLLSKINTGNDDAAKITKAPDDVTQAPVRKSGDVKNAEREHVVDVIDSLTEEDMRILTNLRNSLRDLKNSNRGQTIEQSQDYGRYRDDSRPSYNTQHEKTIGRPRGLSNDRYSGSRDNVVRDRYTGSRDNDADNRYIGVRNNIPDNRYTGSRDNIARSFGDRYSGSSDYVQENRPSYRDTADAAMNKNQYPRGLTDTRGTEGTFQNFVEKAKDSKPMRMVRNMPEWVNGVLRYDVIVTSRDGPASLLWQREVYNICTQNQPWRYECPCKIKTIETNLVKDLQAGLKEGVTLEDLIDDLEKMKSRDQKKRTLVSDEAKQLDDLKRNLRSK